MSEQGRRWPGFGRWLYLGSQGDVWDAQKDMILCGLGTLVNLSGWRPWHLRELGAAASGAIAAAALQNHQLPISDHD